MTVLPATVTRAMALQIDRVKGARQAHSLGEADLLDQLAEADATIARLQARINELELLLAAYDVTVAAPDAARGPSYGQRPTITAVEAAQRAGVSLATVTRYVQSGFWDGIPPRRGHNRLLVYSDQPLTSKATRRRNQGRVK